MRECAKNVGSLPALANASGVPESIISAAVKGKEPEIQYIDAIANAGKVSTEWLITGKGSSERVYSMGDNPKPSPKLENKDTSVPVVSAEASAGGGFTAIEENVVSWIKFDKSWLYNTWHLNPSELFCIPTIGESMEPTIQAGEYLLASRAEHHLKSTDGIYIIRLEGGVLVKRLQFLPGKKIKISSDNKAYDPYVVSLDNGSDFEVIGKVMLVIKQV